MTRSLATAVALFAVLASASSAGATSLPLTSTPKAKICYGGQKYSAKRCGGPRKNIPNYCLDGPRVMGGYVIKNGQCHQNNGGGE